MYLVLNVHILVSTKCELFEIVFLIYFSWVKILNLSKKKIHVIELYIHFTFIFFCGFINTFPRKKKHISFVLQRHV